MSLPVHFKDIMVAHTAVAIPLLSSGLTTLPFITVAPLLAPSSPQAKAAAAGMMSW